MVNKSAYGLRGFVLNLGLSRNPNQKGAKSYHRFHDKAMVRKEGWQTNGGPQLWIIYIKTANNSPGIINSSVYPESIFCTINPFGNGRFGRRSLHAGMEICNRPSNWWSKTSRFVAEALKILLAD